MTTHTLHHGDCLEVLRTMPACSVDACVTDPPYGLSFMGKAWDYNVPTVDVWREVLRVLKPGGHLLAFAGTRTQHRMAVAIEDAGFEIRDMIAWVYGSGFPKSMDVSKAIDKLDASEAQQARRYRFTEWVRSTGLTSKQIDEATGTNMGCHYTTAASQPAIMTREHLDAVRHLIGDVPEWVERECEIRSVESENFKRREVVGVQKNAMSGWRVEDGSTEFRDRDITTPATPEAQQWAGWGTALKPALEPITMARKPFKGTVAACVLEHGTGALNVDGCRIEGKIGVSYRTPGNGEVGAGGIYEGGYRGEWNNANPHPESVRHNAAGRWPANLIHDGSDDVVGLFPDGHPHHSGSIRQGGDHFSVGSERKTRHAEFAAPCDSGSAARFFKQCKGYTEAWPNVTPEPANTAGNCSSQQRRFVASALSDAATWALQGAICSSASLAPSTSATGSELRQLCESVITAIQSIGPRFWHESEPARLSLKLSHASFAVHREPTGITTITASHWTSGGSADPVTFNIIGTSTGAGDQASVPRAFYTAKATRAERQGVTHPTVKPLDLMAYLCRLVTPPGGIVLDPFMGSGTTIKAAVSEGFNAIGIERDADYFAMAEHRMNGAQLGLTLEAAA